VRRNRSSICLLLLSMLLVWSIGIVPAAAETVESRAEAETAAAPSPPLEEKDAAQMVAKLQEDVRNAVPGSVIVIPNGIYRNFTVSLTVYGAENKPVVIRAETPGRVQFSEDVSVTLGGKYFEFRDFYFNEANPRRGSYLVALSRATNARLTGNYFYKSGPKNPTGNVIRIQNNSQYNRIDHNVLQGNTSMGVAVRVNRDNNLENVHNTIDYNYFKDIPSVGSLYPGQGNGLESVQIGQGFGYEDVKVYTKVMYNLFENVTGDGNEIVSNKTANNEYRYNTFLNCKSGFTLRFGGDAVVDSNYFINLNYGMRVTDKNQIVTNNYFHGVDQGIRLYAGRLNVNAAPDRQVEYRTVKNALVANNTIVYPRTGGVVMGDTYNFNPSPGYSYFEPEDSTIANNLIVVKDVTAVTYKKSKNVTYLNNVVKLEGTATIGVPDSGFTVTDPEMKFDPVSGIYRPTKASTILDKGYRFDIDELKKDIKGADRRGAPDVGAEELWTWAQPRPLTVNEVGPENKWWVLLAMKERIVADVGGRAIDKSSVQTLTRKPDLGIKYISVPIPAGSLDGQQFASFDLISVAKQFPEWDQVLVSFVEKHSQEEWGVYVPAFKRGWNNSIVVPLNPISNTGFLKSNNVFDIADVSEIRLRYFSDNMVIVGDFKAGKFVSE